MSNRGALDGNTQNGVSEVAPPTSNHEGEKLMFEKGNQVEIVVGIPYGGHTGTVVAVSSCPGYPYAVFVNDLEAGEDAPPIDTVFYRESELTLVSREKIALPDFLVRKIAAARRAQAESSIGTRPDDEDEVDDAALFPASTLAKLRASSLSDD